MSSPAGPGNEWSGGSQPGEAAGSLERAGNMALAPNSDGIKIWPPAPEKQSKGENRAESGGKSSRKTNSIRSRALWPQSKWEAAGFLPSLLTTRCLARDGVALLVITSCSDREVIDHLRGGSLIEKVSIDRDKSFFS